MIYNHIFQLIQWNVIFKINYISSYNHWLQFHQIDANMLFHFYKCFKTQHSQVDSHFGNGKSQVMQMFLDQVLGDQILSRLGLL